MKEQLISFETAKLAKEKNYIIDNYINWFYEDTILKRVEYPRDEHIVDYLDNFIYKDGQTKKDDPFLLKHNFTDIVEYDKNKYIVTTQSLLQKWLREQHKLNIEIKVMYYEPDFFVSVERIPVKSKISKSKPLYSSSGDKNGLFKTYEEALEKGLQEALKLIEK